MRKFIQHKVGTMCIVLLSLPCLLFSQNKTSSEIQVYFDNWTHFDKVENYDRAIDQAQLAFEVAKKLNDKKLMAISLNKEGRSLLKKKKRANKNRRLAKEKFESSLFYIANLNETDLRIDNLEHLKSIAELNKDKIGVVGYEKQITEIKRLLSESAKNESLSNNNQLLSNNNLVLSSQVDVLAIQQQDLSAAIKSLTQAQLESKLLIALQKNQFDSLGFERTKDSFLLSQNELLLSEQKAKLELQESHIELQNSQLDLHASQRNFSFALVAIIGLLAFGAMMRYWETKRHFSVLENKNQIINEEKKRSEKLLLNILPAMVANELKSNGVAKTRKYENATVLFSDFKNFSGISEILSPEELVRELDFYFKTFDHIISKYKLEKIKTIGDAYMCVGGLPEKLPSHPDNVVMAALEIQSYLHGWKLEKEEKGEPVFEARIGIHTGPLVAGVVGSSKFAFDVWGDTVNVAARLESKSEVGRVNISAATYQLIKNDFECEHRGKIAVKNKGEVEMYFVKGLG